MYTCCTPHYRLIDFEIVIGVTRRIYYHALHTHTQHPRAYNNAPPSSKPGRSSLKNVEIVLGKRIGIHTCTLLPHAIAGIPVLRKPEPV